MTPLFHIVLHRPEIPNNTGNIGRTCIATGCALHLVHPLGFDTSEKACRRAGLDYWPRLGVREHADLAACRSAIGAAWDRTWLFTAQRGAAPWRVPLRRGDVLVFGSETVGLPGPLLVEHGDRLVRLPLRAGERSLNVATVVCAAILEGVRQCAERGEVGIDDAGCLDLEGGRFSDV